MPVSANIFEKCLPAVGNNYDSCGTLGRCSIVTAESDTLADIFTSSGQFRDMGSLLRTQVEMKACGVRENALFDFLMSNARGKGQFVKPRKIDRGPSLIEPFILANQKSVINSEYWLFGNGQASGSNWQIDAYFPAATDLTNDIRWFPERTRVYLNGVSAGGSTIRTAYRVLTAAQGTWGAFNTVTLTLVSENTNSSLAAAKLGNPTVGFMVRGVPNVNDYESWCRNLPAFNPNKEVPIWFETTRWTHCVDELYKEWLGYLMENNPYFAKFGDPTVAEQNRQLYEHFRRSWINSFFWNKKLANQTMAAYRSLEQINSVSDAEVYQYTEGQCVALRANAEGVYEQLADCGRVYDLMGQQLNLIEFFDLIYLIHRNRADAGQPADEIDLFMSSPYAALFQRAMVRYFNDQSEGLIRFNLAVKSPLGFTFDSYKLIFPAGVTINVFTHPFFDDWQAVANAAAVDRAGSMIWCIDWSNVWPAIFGSSAVVHTTGNIADLAKIDAHYACTVRNPTREVKLNSLTWGVGLDCPQQHFILEGLASLVPDHTDKSHTPSYTDLYSYTGYTQR